MNGIRNRSFSPGYLGEYKCTAIGLCVLLRGQPKRINAEVRTAIWTCVLCSCLSATSGYVGEHESVLQSVYVYYYGYKQIHVGVHTAMQTGLETVVFTRLRRRVLVYRNRSMCNTTGTTQKNKWGGSYCNIWTGLETVVSYQATQASTSVLQLVYVYYYRYKRINVEVCTAIWKGLETVVSPQAMQANTSVLQSVYEYCYGQKRINVQVRTAMWTGVDADSFYRLRRLRVQKNTCRGSYCNVDGIGNRSFLPGYVGDNECTVIGLCVLLRVQPKRINAEVRTGGRCRSFSSLQTSTPTAGNREKPHIVCALTSDTLP